jgi:hypothetical protein
MYTTNSQKLSYPNNAPRTLRTPPLLTDARNPTLTSQRDPSILGVAIQAWGSEIPKAEIRRQGPTSASDV